MLTSLLREAEARETAQRNSPEKTDNVKSPALDPLDRSFLKRTTPNTLPLKDVRFNVLSLILLGVAYVGFGYAGIQFFQGDSYQGVVLIVLSVILITLDKIQRNQDQTVS